MHVSFELTGETPLLMHADDVMAADELKAWRQASENKNISVAGDDRSPAWTWQTYCYKDGDCIAMPSENIMVALRQAGSQIILKKQKTFKEISQSGMVIPTDFCEFFCEDKQIDWQDVSAIRDLSFSEQAAAVAKLNLSLFVKRAKVGNAKHVRVRPRFDSWSIKGSITVMASEITFDVLARLFEIAGHVGLCDWRPGCKTPGPYGMFTSKLKKQ